MPARHTDTDTIRAIACLALVSFHVVGSTPTSGMELGSGHPLRALQDVFAPLRMPLFTFISGVVFATAPWPGRDGAWALDRLAAKGRRLLVPMALVGSLFWLARALTGQGQPPFGTFLYLPYAHFWYLQATFLIMAAALGLLWLTRGRAGLSAALLGGSCLLGPALVSLPETSFFSLPHAIRLAPFFAAGLIWSIRDPLAHWDIRGRQHLGMALVIGATLAGYAFAAGLIDTTRASVTVTGLAGCAGLFALRPRHAMLAALGRHSYAIYLFHVFFTAGFLMLAERLWPGAPVAALWGGAMVAGLAGPVLVQTICLAHPVAAFALLGLKRRIPARRNLPIARAAPHFSSK